MMVWTSGRMPPPPTPCSARPAISTPILGASAHTTEPAMKITIAISIMMRRPWMSDSLPNSGVTAVAASRYAVTTHDRFSASASARPMVGKAGATMVCSSADRNAASMMPTTMARIAAWSSGGLDVPARAAFLRVF